MGLNPTEGISKSRMYSAPHFSHRSAKQLPCNSARWSLGKPDLMCRQSTLHDTRYLTNPARCSSTSAMCVGVGLARSNLHLAGGMGSPLFCRVHTPLGPRKSGIPADVEIPAPVCTVTPSFASRKSSARRSILPSRSFASGSESSGSPRVPPTSSRQLSRSA